MNDNLHVRAQRLLAESVVEGLRPADETWLREHLTECPACAQEASATQNALRALRAVPVHVPRDLAARTQLPRSTPRAGSFNRGKREFLALGGNRGKLAARGPQRAAGLARFCLARHQLWPAEARYRNGIRPLVGRAGAGPRWERSCTSGH